MPDDFERLERDVERLSRAVSYPVTPPLAAAVRETLETQARPAARRPGPWALAGAGLAAVVAVALVLGLWSPGREAVADFFDRLRNFQTQESPAGLPTEISGTPVSLAEAEERLGFTPMEATCPKGVQLKRALYQEFPGFRAVVLFYEHEVEPSFALFQTEGGLGKGLPFGAEAEPVARLGAQAYWLEGLRIVEYYDEQGALIQESQRATDTNTLIWSEGGFVFRVEGDLSKELAICVAQSLR